MKAVIYRQLVEVAGLSWYSPELALDVFNEQKDLREMQLHAANEGYGVSRHFHDLVAGQALYLIPVEAGRVVQVFRIFPEGEERPMIRDERWVGDLDPNFSGALTSYIPRYKIQGANLRLIPPPSEAQSQGIAIEMEECSELIADDDSTLPIDWPLFAESLLILDTITGMLDIEAATAESDDSTIKGFYIRRRRYEVQWLAYIEERTKGLVYAEPFHMSD
jgi:hypothetical protein